MTHRPEVASPPATPAPQRDVTLLIADVAALTGVPPPQLRSWEQAGILHPRRSPNAIRLYGIEDVARVRLIKRALINPGRRGSLRRLAAQLAAGTLMPNPEDYAGLDGAPTDRAELTGAGYWQAVVDAMAELVVVCDTRGRMTAANPALRALLASTAADSLPAVEPAAERERPSGSPASEALPAVLEALPLRWAALTGTQHRDVALVLRGPDGTERHTLWTVTPLWDAAGASHGAVGVGRAVPPNQPAGPDDWLAIAAHDLRSPITNILGRVQLARRAVDVSRAGSVPTLEQEAVGTIDQHLAIAELSILDLIRTMNTLLDAGAAASGSLLQHLDAGAVALDLLTEQAVEHAQGHTTRHLLSLEVAAAPLLVIGDDVRLRQVLDNLLANAMKYAPDGGPITVRLEAVAALPLPPPDPPLWTPAAGADPPRWVLARVADTGLGIPAADVPHVFDRYWRAGGATHRLPGAGLGLFTCRAIVAAHGGHIWVERSAPAAGPGEEAAAWHGTVMAVLLPLASAPEPAAEADVGSTAGVPGTVVG